MKKALSLLLSIMIILSLLLIPAYGVETDPVVVTGSIHNSGVSFQITQSGILRLMGTGFVYFTASSAQDLQKHFPINTIDIAAGVTELRSDTDVQGFASLTSLEKVIFHSTTPPTISPGYFSGDKDITVYHPASDAWTTEENNYKQAVKESLYYNAEDGKRCFYGGTLSTATPFADLSAILTSSVTKSATCTEAGTRTYSCPYCGAGTEETIPLVSHSYGADHLCTYKCGTVDPACTCSTTDSEGRVTYYATDVASALSSATDGSTFSLTSDYVGADKDMMLQNAVNLDLNGHSLQLKSLIITNNAAQISDSSNGGAGGGGILKLPAEAGSTISKTNTQLPLYDSEDGGYRFYSCSFLKAAPTTTSGTQLSNGETKNCILLRYQLRLDNLSGYDLMDDSSNLNNLGVTLTWEGGSYKFAFGQDLVRQYAAACKSAGSNTSYMLYVYLYNYEAKLAGKTLTVAAAFENTLTPVEKNVSTATLNIPGGES